MTGRTSMEHEEKINLIFKRVIEIFKLDNFIIKVMRRQVDEWGKGVLNLKKSYTLAHTNLKNKTITIDIYTPRHRKPKSIKSILNILAHEIAHHQKPPFRQMWRPARRSLGRGGGRIIARRHYPAFYRQVNKNIEKIRRDRMIGEYLTKSN